MKNDYFYKEDIDLIWKDCIFVFDTSVILSFYDFSKQYIYELLDNQLPKLGKDKMILPGHVYYEYLKNRERIINKDIYYNECIEKLENDNFSYINHVISNIDEIFKLTINKEKHPYLESEKLTTLQSKSMKYQKEYQIILEGIKKEIEDRKKEINDLINNDIILEKVKQCFTIGADYKFDEYIDILKEAQERYEFEISPGFADYKEKKGIQRCGDLAIWKQMLDLSKKEEVNIIFITNDVKKNDWCYVDKRGRISEPKEELIKEFVDYTDRKIWMYTFEQFLYEIKNRNLVNVSEELIVEVEAINSEEFVVVDIETTGLSPQNNEILSIDAIKYKEGKVVNVFSSMVKPKKRIPRYITAITGIKEEDTNNAPDIDKVMEEFKEFVRKEIIVAHNANFNLSFLNKYSNNYFINYQVIDTVGISRTVFPHLPNHKLETIAKYINLNIDKSETDGQKACRCAAEIYMRKQ